MARDARKPQEWPAGAQSSSPANMSLLDPKATELSEAREPHQHFPSALSDSPNRGCRTLHRGTWGGRGGRSKPEGPV